MCNKGEHSCCLFLSCLFPQLDEYQENNWKGDIELRKGMEEITTFTLHPTRRDSNSTALVSVKHVLCAVLMSIQRRSESDLRSCEVT